MVRFVSFEQLELYKYQSMLCYLKINHRSITFVHSSEYEEKKKLNVEIEFVG